VLNYRYEPVTFGVPITALPLEIIASFKCMAQGFEISTMMGPYLSSIIDRVTN